MFSLMNEGVDLLDARCYQSSRSRFLLLGLCVWLYSRTCRSYLFLFFTTVVCFHGKNFVIFSQLIFNIESVELYFYRLGFIYGQPLLVYRHGYGLKIISLTQILVWKPDIFDWLLNMSYSEDEFEDEPSFSATSYGVERVNVSRSRSNGQANSRPTETMLDSDDDDPSFGVDDIELHGRGQRLRLSNKPPEVLLRQYKKSITQSVENEEVKSLTTSDSKPVECWKAADVNICSVLPTNRAVLVI